MSRSSPKFSHEPVNEFFYDIWALSSEDERAGNDSMGSYGLFRFRRGLDPTDMDTYNEKQQSFEDQINAEEIILLCTQAVGAVIHENTQGFVHADVYTDVKALDEVWKSIEDDTMLEQCDACQAEAEEYGKGNPVRHLALCPLAV